MLSALDSEHEYCTGLRLLPRLSRRRPNRLHPAGACDDGCRTPRARHRPTGSDRRHRRVGARMVRHAVHCSRHWPAVSSQHRPGAREGLADTRPPPNRSRPCALGVRPCRRLHRCRGATPRQGSAHGSYVLLAGKAAGRRRPGGRRGHPIAPRLAHRSASAGCDFGRIARRLGAPRHDTVDCPPSGCRGLALGAPTRETRRGRRPHRGYRSEYDRGAVGGAAPRRSLRSRDR